MVTKIVELITELTIFCLSINKKHSKCIAKGENRGEIRIGSKTVRNAIEREGRNELWMAKNAKSWNISV